MNSPLRKVAVACLLLFGLLLVNANYVQVVRAGDYRDDPRNSRVLQRTYDRERGAVVVEGDAVARSIETDDRLRYLRTYPGGEVYAPVTGFYSLVYGATGIERTEDNFLSGEASALVVRRLSDLVTGREPRGAAVVLTLRRAAQQAAYDGLEGKTGAVVALDPRTGAILAMTSTPSYDPAPLSSHEPADIRETYEELVEDDSDPLLNRAISQTYPPGSTFKVVTAAAALESGQYQPDTRLPSPREFDLPLSDRTIPNFGGFACEGGEMATLADALKFSCNTPFAFLGGDLGAPALREQAQAFGFGSDDLTVPLSVQASRFPSDPDAPQLAQSGIGQFDVRMTPLQGAMIAAAVANKGELKRPFLVDEIQNTDLSTLEQTQESTLEGDVISDSTADALTAMMRGVVEGGSGTAAQIPGVVVAGKTGTAQHAPGEPPHAWFIGFAGDEGEPPRVAVAVLVERGGDAGSEATGGRVAAPIARSVMEAVLSAEDEPR